MWRFKFIFITLFLTSCVSEKESQSNSIYDVSLPSSTSNQSNPSSTLNCYDDGFQDIFQDIFDKKINAKIYCLENTLKNDIPTYVKTSSRKHIQKKEFLLLTNNLFSKDQTLTHSIDFLYEINSFLFNDDKEELSFKNITSISKILQNINSHGIKLNRLYRYISNKNTHYRSYSNKYLQVRNNIYQELENLFIPMVKIIKNNEKASMIDQNQLENLIFLTSLLI